jgi:hypothetical protein
VCGIQRKEMCSGGQWEAAFRAYRGGRKIRESGRLFYIHEVTLKKPLKLNVTDNV